MLRRLRVGRAVRSRLRFKARSEVEHRFYDWPSCGRRCRRRPCCIPRKGSCVRGWRRGRGHRSNSIDQLMVMVVVDVVQRLKSWRLQRGSNAGLLKREDRRGRPAVGRRRRRNLDRAGRRRHHGYRGRARRCHRNSTSTCATRHLAAGASAAGFARGSAENRRRWQGKLMKMLRLMLMWLRMLLMLLLLLLWHGGYHRCLYHRKALWTVGTHTTTGSVRSFNYVFLFLPRAVQPTQNLPVPVSPRHSAARTKVTQFVT